MRTEIPTCRRCCFCLPLRYGLITWGYFRVMLAGFMLLGASMNLQKCLGRLANGKGNHNVLITDIVFLSILIMIIVADIILGVIFIISCHKKNVNWMSKYYRYTIVLLTFFITLSLYCLWSVAYHIYTSKPPFSIILAFILLDLFSLFTYIVIQIYAALLIRSEIIKLKNNCQYRFKNNAAEAECSLRTDNSIEQNDREDKIDIDDIRVTARV